MRNESDFAALRERIIERALSDEKSLPLMARGAEDPGEAYFAQAKEDLKKLFEALEGQSKIDRTLAAALFAMSHQSYVNYEAAVRYGHEFRDTLFDPDLIDLEMAVESIFTGKWVTLLNDS